MHMQRYERQISMKDNIEMPKYVIDMSKYTVDMSTNIVISVKPTVR